MPTAAFHISKAAFVASVTVALIVGIAFGHLIMAIFVKEARQLYWLDLPARVKRFIARRRRLKIVRESDVVYEDGNG